MNTLNARITLVVLLSMAGLLACNPQATQLSPSPVTSVQYRLKSVQNTTQNSIGNYTYTYSYDGQNRPVSINRVNDGVSSLAVITYGDQQLNYVNTAPEANRTFYVEYPDPADQTQGQVTLYPLPLDGVDFVAKRYYLLNAKVFYSAYDRTYQYYFDANKRINGFNDIGNSSPIDQNNYSYEYTGENVTGEQFSTAAGHGLHGTATYTYDTQLNPFFGLLDPKIDPARRFSRNNAVSILYSTTSLPTTTYAYDYNAQGLPTKRTTTYNGAVTETLTYTYENY